MSEDGMMAGTGYPMAQSEKQAVLSRRPDITLRQNLEDQIVQAEKRLKALKDTQARLETSGILDSRIEDIQQAMRW